MFLCCSPKTPTFSLVTSNGTRPKTEKLEELGRSTLNHSFPLILSCIVWANNIYLINVLHVCAFVLQILTNALGMEPVIICVKTKMEDFDVSAAKDTISTERHTVLVMSLSLQLFLCLSVCLPVCMSVCLCTGQRSLKKPEIDDGVSLHKLQLVAKCCNL